MGKASSSKKVARAARAAGRPGARRSLGWPVLLGGVVVLGLVLIVVSRGKTTASVAPKLGDHWHAAYGIYDCDHFISPLTDVIKDDTGVHTHGDGLMHIHPFATQYTGKGANLGDWGITTGLELSDTSVKAAGIARKNGDTCGSKKGKLQLKAWDSPTAATGRLIPADLAKYAPQEFTLWTLAFVPEGTDIPKPPKAAIAALQAPADVAPGGANTVPPTGTSGSTPVITATSVVGNTGSTAPGDTTPTTASPSTTATSAP